MIRVDVSDFSKQIADAIADFADNASAKDTKKGLANALYKGAKVITAAARQLAPKGGRRKKGQAKTYGNTGLLRRSYTTKKGVTKSGQGSPYAIVGPSATLAENVRRGRRSVTVKPSNYAHLVEFGHNVHHRVPGVAGRNHERFVKKSVLWQPSTLEDYLKRKQIEVNNLSKGKRTRIKAFLGGSGQGISRVGPQHIVLRAYRQSVGVTASTITSNIAIEIDKAAQRSYLRQVRKYNPHASGLRGVR